MSLPLIVLLVALAGVAELGSRSMHRGPAWTVASPALAICAWHGLALTFVGSLLAAAALASHDVLEHALLAATGADKAVLHVAYAGPRVIDGAWNLAAGLIVLLLVLGASAAWRTTRARSRARREADERCGFIPDSSSRTISVVQDTELFAFTTPPALLTRRRARVIVSSAVLDVLTSRQAQAVLAHEMSHARRHHHQTLALADVLAGSVRWTGALRHYRRGVAALVEMHADDDASTATSRADVAQALVAMSSVRGPGLAMATTRTADRVHRLLELDRGVTPASRPVARLLTASSLGATALPPLCALLPLLLST